MAYNGGQDADIKIHNLDEKKSCIYQSLTVQAYWEKDNPSSPNKKKF